MNVYHLFRLLCMCSLLSAAILAPAGAAGDRSGKCPGWLPPGEVSAFFPDDGFLIRPDLDGALHNVYFRHAFSLPAQPRRAVLALSACQLAAARLNGAEVLEVHCPSVDRLPGFADVTSRLRAGENTLDVRVHSEWAADVYAQLRVELPDGTFLDVATDDGWEWRRAPEAGWPRGPAPADGWVRVRVTDDYYGSGGKATGWAKEFALMPRGMLRETMASRAEGFRASWLADQAAPKPRFQGTYAKPEYAAGYRDFLRLDPKSGQVVDANGRIRHLFFTIYGQKAGGLSPWTWDYDRVEDDLALMEQGEVHPYLRFTGWGSMLDRDGRWARCTKQPAGEGLPKYEWNYQVLDHFLDRCQAHGRFAVIEGDFYWNASLDAVPPPYHTRYYLYPEVAEVNALAHRKILSRYAGRPVVAGYMIGEEDVIMDPDLENSHLRGEFAGYLQGRYQTLDRMRRTWGAGYDFADHSLWKPARRKAEQWGGDVREDVLPPAYPVVASPWAGLAGWADVPLPSWPCYRSTDAPNIPLPSHRSLNTEAPLDPTWIDYNAFREDVLYPRFVNRWAEVVRPAAPRQWLFHSNAQDFTAQWHFLHFYRRAGLEFDVIGTGSHDEVSNLSEIAPYDRMRKYYANVASYRAYTLAPGSPAVALSCGEGQGGNEGNEGEILNYYRAQSFELLGHGGAFELSYTWQHMSGAGKDPEGKAHLTKGLQWMGGFYRAIEGVRFSLQRPVDVLVVANNNLARSNRSGRDYGNILALSDFLGQLNVEFDIAMDQDLVCGIQPRKIDLNTYRVLFLPCLDCDYPEDVWRVLDTWLTDPKYRGKRSLVLGYVGKRTPYVTPTGRFHPVLARWLGIADYAAEAPLRKENEVVWTPLAAGAAPRKITLNFGERDMSPVGVFGAGRPILATPGGQVIAAGFTHAGNAIHAFGFPLGLNYDYVWAIPAKQQPYDLLASVFEELVDSAGVARPVRAPHNVRVALSDDRSIVLVQERFGIETTDLCRLKLPKGAQYEGCETVPQPDGTTLLRTRLAPYEGVYLRRRVARPIASAK